MARKITAILLSIFFLSVAGYSLYKIIHGLNEYKVGEEAYDSLAGFVELPESPSNTSKPVETLTDDTVHTDTESDTDAVTVPKEIPAPKVDFDSLEAINDDITAWIYLEGTKINYPILKGNDNDWYLNHLPDGTYNSAGSIFMDYRCSADFSDRHTILYGHHMNNDTMFNAVTYYRDQSFYDSHPYCVIVTPDGAFKVSFFAGYVATVDGDSWRVYFDSDEDYLRWIGDAVAKSSFKSTVTPKGGDKVVTMSTCSNEYEDARFVLLGVAEPIVSEK